MHSALFKSGLYGQLRQQTGRHWQNYVQHPFVAQLSTGILPQAAFRRYLSQDYLFLIHFARAYGLLVSKLDSAVHMRSATAALNAIINELPLHLAYCVQWGLQEEDFAALPEASETMNYTRFVLDVGHRGDSLDLLAALMPCVAGYAEIGLQLLHSPNTVWQDNPYATWIKNYADKDYLSGVQASLNLFESVGQQKAGQHRLADLTNIFSTATLLETAFWQMGLNAAEQIP